MEEGIWEGDMAKIGEEERMRAQRGTKQGRASWMQQDKHDSKDGVASVAVAAMVGESQQQMGPSEPITSTLPWLIHM